jgi:hypothetical protein
LASESAGAAAPATAVAAPAASAGGAAAVKASSKKKGSKGGSATAGEALLPSLGPASSAAAPAGYKATGCKVQWSCQGLGGYAYAVAAQHPSPDMLRAAPQYTPVHVAVGCGDKTIRVLTLGVRQQLLQISSCSSSSTTASCSRGLAASDTPAEACVHDAADAATQACASSSSSGGEDAGNGQQHMSGACSEVQSGVQYAQLLWRNIQDKVLAVAWHPTNPRE